MSSLHAGPCFDDRLHALLRDLTIEQAAVLLDLLDDINYVLWNTRGDALLDYFTRLGLAERLEPTAPPDPPDANSDPDDDVPF